MSTAEKLLNRTKFIDESKPGEMDADTRKIHDFIKHLSHKISLMATEEISLWAGVNSDPTELTIAATQAQFKSIATFLNELNRAIAEADAPQSKEHFIMMKQHALMGVASFYASIKHEFTSEDDIKIMDKVFNITADKLKERDKNGTS